MKDIITEGDLVRFLDEDTGYYIYGTFGGLNERGTKGYVQEENNGAVHLIESHIIHKVQSTSKVA